MNLRTYQFQAIDAARAARRAGHRRILLSSPTGSGKTVIAVAMIARAVELGDRVLVIAHRKELIDQFWSRLQDVGIDAGVMRSTDERTDVTRPVQLGTIQTLTRRDLPPAGLVVVDEAHRCPGESYARVLEAYPRATVLGLTATPSRLDGRPLKEHFDALIQVAAYSALIDQGSIIAPVVYAAREPPDVRKVKRLGGDFSEKGLETAVRKGHVMGDVVASWQRLAEGRSTVLFAVGIEHSRDLVERFVAAGVKAEHLDGMTPEDERQAILVRLETGKTTLVSNVGVLCEGWDQPSVKCCIMARPTLSLTLWMQCSGRILRPYRGQKALILDHSGNVDRHGLPHEDREWSLDGAVTRKSQTDRIRICGGCYAYVTASPCPLCGHATPERPRKVVQVDGVLERVNGAIKREQAADPKRAYFDTQVELAKKRGFKPGYASAKYKEKFDDAWPPWAWSQAVKEDYSRDADWQERVEERVKEREYWKSRAEVIHAPAEAVEEPRDASGEDWFSDL